MILQDSYLKLTENFRKFCGVKIARNEICYILIGKRIGRFWFGRLVKKVIGSPGSVEFDWEWVLKREEEKGDVIGFWHSHPSGEIELSFRDSHTTIAWETCFYKPLLCVIQVARQWRCYRCFRYYGVIDDARNYCFRPIPLFKIGPFFFARRRGEAFFVSGEIYY